MTALCLLPRGRRTGSPRSCSQRCTVRVPLPRYSATSFQELRISLLESSVAIVAALTINETTDRAGPDSKSLATKLGVWQGTGPASNTAGTGSIATVYHQIIPISPLL